MSFIGMTFTNDSVHYLAALLEGEGSFMKGPPSSPNLPIVKVEMCDEDVIRHVASLVEASVSVIDRFRERGYKRVYRVLVKGSRAVQIMLAIRPLMGLRRTGEIAVALASYRGTKVVRTGRGPCATDGCGEPSEGRGMCHRHYNRWLKRRGGKADPPSLETLDPKIELRDTPSARRHYLAALLEGEGNFSLGPRRQPMAIRVGLTMTDQDVMERARIMMGARGLYADTHGASRGWRTAYRAAVSSRRAETLMRELRPLMFSRRKHEIDVALKAREALPYLRLIPAPPHCTIDGCIQPHRGRGMCHKHQTLSICLLSAYQGQIERV